MHVDNEITNQNIEAENKYEFEVEKTEEVIDINLPVEESKMVNKANEDDQAARAEEQEITNKGVDKKEKRNNRSIQVPEKEDNEEGNGTEEGKSEENANQDQVANEEQVESKEEIKQSEEKKERLNEHANVQQNEADINRNINNKSKDKINKKNKKKKGKKKKIRDKATKDEEIEQERVKQEDVKKEEVKEEKINEKGTKQEEIKKEEMKEEGVNNEDDVAICAHVLNKKLKKEYNEESSNSSESEKPEIDIELLTNKYEDSL